MTYAVPLWYALVAALCLTAPYATTSAGVADAVLPFVPGPLALASLALGFSVYLRPGRVWLDGSVALLWSAGAIALSIYLSSPPLAFEDLFLGIRIQTILSGTAAVALVVAAAQVWRRPGHRAVTVVHAIALLGIAALLGYRSLGGLGLIPTGTGIEGISRWLVTAQAVLVGCSAVIFLVLGGPRVLAMLRRRPTNSRASAAARKTDGDR